MQTVETILHLLTILVVLGMAGKFGLARGILTYHQDIIADKAAAGNSGLKRVVGALYQAVAAGAVAVAVSYAVLVFRVEPATGFGKGYAFLVICVFALPPLISTYRVEQASSVRTPWRFVAVGIVLAAVAYAI